MGIGLPNGIDRNNNSTNASIVHAQVIVQDEWAVEEVVGM